MIRKPVAAFTPSTAGPGTPVTEPGTTSATGVTGATSTQTATLVTGDTVKLTTGPDGRSAVDVERGKGREAANFVSTEQDGEISVVPEDALPLVQAGRLDPALFNVSQLVRQGYTDAATGGIPLIAGYEKGAATPRGRTADTRAAGHRRRGTRRREAHRLLGGHRPDARHRAHREGREAARRRHRQALAGRQGQGGPRRQCSADRRAGGVAGGLRRYGGEGHGPGHGSGRRAPGSRGQGPGRAEFRAGRECGRRPWSRHPCGVHDRRFGRGLGR